MVSLIFNDFVCFDTPEEVLTKTPTIDLQVVSSLMFNDVFFFCFDSPEEV